MPPPLGLHQLRNTDFAKLTRGDGNCGPRAAIEAALMAGILDKRKRAKVIEFLQNIYKTRADDSVADNIAKVNKKTFNDFIAAYKSIDTPEDAESFAKEYLPPTDPTSAAVTAGETLITALSLKLLAALDFYVSNHAAEFSSEEKNQFKPGKNASMEYAVAYFANFFGLNLFIHSATGSTIRIAKYEDPRWLASEAAKNAPELHLVFRGGASAHYDVYVEKASLDYYLTVDDRVVELSDAGSDAEPEEPSPVVVTTGAGRQFAEFITANAISISDTQHTQMLRYDDGQATLHTVTDPAVETANDNNRVCTVTAEGALIGEPETGDEYIKTAATCALAFAFIKSNMEQYADEPENNPLNGRVPISGLGTPAKAQAFLRELSDAFYDGGFIDCEQTGFKFDEADGSKYYIYQALKSGQIFANPSNDAELAREHTLKIDALRTRFGFVEPAPAPSRIPGFGYFSKRPSAELDAKRLRSGSSSSSDGGLELEPDTNPDKDTFRDPETGAAIIPDKPVTAKRSRFWP